MSSHARQPRNNKRLRPQKQPAHPSPKRLPLYKWEQKIAAHPSPAQRISWLDEAIAPYHKHLACPQKNPHKEKQHRHQSYTGICALLQRFCLSDPSVDVRRHASFKLTSLYHDDPMIIAPFFSAIRKYAAEKHDTFFLSQVLQQLLTSSPKAYQMRQEALQKCNDLLGPQDARFLTTYRNVPSSEEEHVAEKYLATFQTYLPSDLIYQIILEGLESKSRRAFIIASRLWSVIAKKNPKELQKNTIAHCIKNTLNTLKTPYNTEDMEWMAFYKTREKYLRALYLLSSLPSKYTIPFTSQLRQIIRRFQHGSMPRLNENNDIFCLACRCLASLPKQYVFVRQALLASLSSPSGARDREERLAILLQFKDESLALGQFILRSIVIQHPLYVWGEIEKLSIFSKDNLFRCISLLSEDEQKRLYATLQEIPDHLLSSKGTAFFHVMLSIPIYQGLSGLLSLVQQKASLRASHALLLYICTNTPDALKNSYLFHRWCHENRDILEKNNPYHHHPFSSRENLISILKYHIQQQQPHPTTLLPWQSLLEEALLCG